MGSAKQSFFTIKKGRQTTMIFQSRIKGGLSRRAVLPAVTFLVAVLTVGTHASSKRQTHVTGQTDVTGQTQATGQTGTYELNEYVTMCGQRLRELQNLKWRCSNSTETPQKVGAKGILVNPRSRVQTTLSQTLSKYYRQEIKDKLPQVPQKVVPFLNAQIKATQDEIAAEQKSLNKYYKTMKKIEAIRKCNLLGDIKDIFWNSAELVIKGMVATHTLCGEQELTKRVETFTRCTTARTNMEPEKPKPEPDTCTEKKALFAVEEGDNKYLKPLKQAANSSYNYIHGVGVGDKNSGVVKANWGALAVIGVCDIGLLCGWAF